MKRLRLPWLLGLAVFLLAGLSFVLLESFTPKRSAQSPGQAFSAAEEIPVETEIDPWAQAWVNQEQYLESIVSATAALRKDLPELARKLQSKVTPYEVESRRLFVLANTYTKNPRVLEAVSHRIQNTGTALRASMEPALDAREVAADLLEKVNQLEKTLPANAKDAISASKELRAYVTSLTQVKKQLNESIARLDSALVQPTTLRDKITKANKDIDGYLPVLWQQQYLLPPVRYTDAALWADMPVKLTAMVQNFNLRLGLEIPQTQAAWNVAIARFLTIFLFGGVLAFFLRSRWMRRKNAVSTAPNGGNAGASTDSPDPNGQNGQDDQNGQDEDYPETVVPLSVFYTSVPWLLAGVALTATAVTSSQSTVYQGLLAMGNLLLIVGQITLAWGLRHHLCELCPRLSPFWPLCLTTLAGYVLLYPELPVNLMAAIWFGILVLALLWQRRRRPDIPLQLETTLLQINGVVLWLALFMVLVGLPRYSILFYILFTSLAVAIQLSMGGMHALHAAAQNMPKEGVKAVLGSIWLALAAPSMIVLVLLGVALWLVTLPGGYYLLRDYAVAGVSVGDTRFSLLQILLILSAFYITRTAVGMGSSFLSKMPSRGIKIDASLIPPLQTAFSYGMWALFGLFVLKSLGMELSNLAVVAGGLSVGIGFGMQAIVNNFLSGLILIFSRVLQEGDVVDVGGLTCTVRKISVRATTVETYDNAVIYVPNAEFVSNRLINWTRNSRSVRREIAVGVAYGTDTDLVMRLLREAANGNPGVLKYPGPSVLFSNFGNSTLDFILRFWVHDFDTAVPTASALRQDVEKLFRQHEVEVAFPQMDVHIKELPQGAKKIQRKPRPVASAEPARRLEDMDKERQAKRAAALAEAGVRPSQRRRVRPRVRKEEGEQE